MKKNIFKNKKGFSLVEILAVITILGILGAVAVVSFTNLTKDTENNDGHMKAEILTKQVVKYATENNGAIPTVVPNADYTNNPRILDKDLLFGSYTKDKEKYEGNFFIYGRDNKVYYDYPPEYIKFMYDQLKASGATGLLKNGNEIDITKIFPTNLYPPSQYPTPQLKYLLIDNKVVRTSK